MRVPQTSIDAFNKLDLKGLFAKTIKWMVANANNTRIPPPWTAREIGMLVREQNTPEEQRVREPWKRMAAMEQLRLLVRGPIRVCSVTHERVVTWFLPTNASQIPTLAELKELRKIQRSKTKSGRLKTVLDRTLAELKAMRKHMLEHNADGVYIARVSQALQKINEWYSQAKAGEDLSTEET